MQTHTAPQNTDLFPETLLVSREGERIFTTSRRVAWHFGKKHKNVLRLIEKLLADLGVDPRGRPKIGPSSPAETAPDEVGGRLNFAPSSSSETDFSRLNFEPANYLDEQNKPRPEYRLSKAGFMFVALRFTGKEATLWQKAFIDAFERQEAELAALRERYLVALDLLHPNLRPTVEEFERGLPRSVTAARLGKSMASVTYHRRRARHLGLLPARQGVLA